MDLHLLIECYDLLDALPISYDEIAETVSRVPKRKCTIVFAV